MKGVLTNKGKSWYLCAVAAVIALVTALYVLFTYQTVLPNSLNGTDIVVVLLIGVALQVVLTIFPVTFAPLFFVIVYSIGFGLVLNKIPPAIVDKINGIFYNGGDFTGCMIYAAGTCLTVLLSLIACFMPEPEAAEGEKRYDKVMLGLAALALIAAIAVNFGKIFPAAPQSGTTPGGQQAEQPEKDPNALVIKATENAFKDYTAEQFAAIPLEEWAKKVDSVGIAYDFNGQYTEAYAIQLNPTYFDAYLYNDGSVYATYNADYVASGRASNGGGDGHADSESLLGYWYNVDEMGDDCLIIQWVAQVDYESAHVISYTLQSAMLPAPSSGMEYQGAFSLTYNGNSRTCFLYGNKYVPYKPATLKVDASGAPKAYNGANEIQSHLLKITCERENGKTVEVPTYLFDYSFDKDGNVTIDYPILGLKDTTSYKITVTPTVYKTQAMKDGKMVDVEIVRDSSGTAILKADGKQARFAYDIEYYRNVFTVGDFVEDAANTMTAEEFASYGTKYYFMGYSQHVDVQGVDTIEVVSAPDGDVLTPEINHYKMADPEHAGWYHYEPRKGPGVYSQDCELIRFEEFVAFRFLVNVNGEWVANKAVIDSFEDGILKIKSVTKFGNNVSGRTTENTYKLEEDTHAMTSMTQPSWWQG
ncbi:MAG: hypothetical protein IKQ96_07880 [Lachnospiraceae bacterium]|nr:hypothetical protein [Lachnospiraceae bacterium]